MRALRALARPRPRVLSVIDLPPGTYLARVDSNPFTDDCGLELNEKAGKHAVFGILAEGGGR